MALSVYKATCSSQYLSRDSNTRSMAATHAPTSTLVLLLLAVSLSALASPMRRQADPGSNEGNGSTNVTTLSPTSSDTQTPAATASAATSSSPPSVLDGDPTASYTAIAPDGTVTFTYDYNVEGIGRYTPSNPLVVSPGDTVILKCLNDSFSNVWRQTTARQVTDCSCSAVDNNLSSEPGRCDYASMFDDNAEVCRTDCEERSREGECLGRESEIRLLFTTDSGNVDISRDFEPGTVYYFTSYSNGTDIREARSDRAYGGECASKQLTFAVNFVDPSQVTTGRGTGTTDSVAMTTSDGTDASVSVDENSTGGVSRPEIIDPIKPDRDLLPNNNVGRPFIEGLSSGSVSLHGTVLLVALAVLFVLLYGGCVFQFHV